MDTPQDQATIRLGIATLIANFLVRILFFPRQFVLVELCMIDNQQMHDVDVV